MPSRKQASAIELVVRCDCGFEARGTEDFKAVLRSFRESSGGEP